MRCQVPHLNEDHHQRSISTVWLGYAMAYARFDFRERLKRISVLEFEWVLLIDNIFLNSVRNTKTNNFNLFSR